MRNKIIEGYWYTPSTPNYPNPVAQLTSVSSEFIEKLKSIQDNNAAKKYYKGLSVCRLCHCDNGSTEYTYKNYIWPSGYMHYLTVHNVHPLKEFYNFIMNL